MRKQTIDLITQTLRREWLCFSLILISLLYTGAEAVGSDTVPSEVQAVKARGPRPVGVVSLHGELKVIGTRLCDKHGTPIQLKGMSAHQLQNYPWTSNTVANLIKQYHNSMIRAAMYIEEEGYLADPAGMKAKEKILIDAAIANDIYVIIDWHGVGGDPNKYTEQAKAFFKEMSATYASYPNVIYEIYNEPTSDWKAIKTYANEIIPVIRAKAQQSVIVVGTPNFCSAPQDALSDPLHFTNVMYTLHFYCGDATKESDGQGQRDNVGALIEKGLPIFVTEWGTSNYTGDGGPYPKTAKKWLDFMGRYNLSWANWSLATKAEGSAFLKPTASMSGPWTDGDLTAAGLFLKDKF